MSTEPSAIYQTQINVSSDVLNHWTHSYCTVIIQCVLTANDNDPKN